MTWTQYLGMSYLGGEDKDAPAPTREEYEAAQRQLEHNSSSEGRMEQAERLMRDG